MALVIPLMLTLLFGGVEVANYFYDEHRLVKAVRDGARYAARQRFSNYIGCTGSPPQMVIDETKLIVRKGLLDSTASDLLANWDDAGTVFTVKTSCVASLDSGVHAPSGIYDGLADGARTVTVTAQLPYRPVLGTPFGFSGIGARLNARQHAAVTGL